jgi:hypothetical protein
MPPERESLLGLLSERTPLKKFLRGKLDGLSVGYGLVFTEAGLSSLGEEEEEGEHPASMRPTSSADARLREPSSAI